MIGKIFITRHGYDPQLGKHVKDPYLGPIPTFGACRPDFRKQLHEGDHIFVISGKVKGANQYVMGGFEVDRKISAFQAYDEYPNLRLKKLSNGELTGNIIVDGAGMQHPLDDHRTFESRITNYIIGRNLLAIESDEEIELGRKDTLPVLSDILKKKGNSPIEVVGRWGSEVGEKEIGKLREWLASLKVTH